MAGTISEQSSMSPLIAIDCPREQQATFTFSMNAFCRLGPITKYEKVATFLKGESVQIFGRNQNEPRWWLVGVPGTSEHCWAADSTGKAAGNLEDLEFVAAPPLVISPVNGNQEMTNLKPIHAQRIWIQGLARQQVGPGHKVPRGHIIAIVSDES